MLTASFFCIWHKPNDAPLTVEDLAEQAGISSRHFARAFIRAFGQPPQSLLRTARAG